MDDFDFCNVRSSIKLIRDESDSFWNRTDHNIMDILLVAIQLALAHIAKQSVLFLGQLEKVCMGRLCSMLYNLHLPSHS